MFQSTNQIQPSFHVIIIIIIMLGLQLKKLSNLQHEMSGNTGLLGPKDFLMANKNK
jgi:hypothetical protein